VVERGRRTGDLSRGLLSETYVRDHLSVALEIDPCSFHFTAGAEPRKEQISLTGDPLPELGRSAYRLQSRRTCILAPKRYLRNVCRTPLNKT
jgi:hypothetical protein